MLTSVNKKLDVSVIVIELRDAVHHHQEQQLGVPPLIVCGTPQTLRPAGSALLAVPSTVNYPMKEMSTADSDVTQLTSS